MAFADVDDAIAAIGRGEIVVVVDDHDRENEGDLIMAAEKATPAAIAFIVRHTSGVICAALTGARLRALQLPLMVADNAESQGTAFTITVDYRKGTTTGISAADRASTLRALADLHIPADDFARPGHVFSGRALSAARPLPGRPPRPGPRNRAAHRPDLLGDRFPRPRAGRPRFGPEARRG